MTRMSTGLKRSIAVALASVSMFSVTAASAAEILVWCWDPNFNGATMEEAFSRYQAEHPDDTIRIEIFDKAAMEQKLQTQLASGTTEGLPDIVLIEDYRAQKYLLSFPGAFEPLTDEIDYSAFAPYKVEVSTVDGQTYSMPFDSGVTGLFYRADALEEAGYTAADLENITWDQLIEIGQGVKEKTGETLLPIDPNASDLFRIMMQSAGTWYFDAEGNVTIADNPVFHEVLATYQRILAADISKTVSGWTEYTGSFTSGDTLATPTGVWMTATIKANPEQSGQWGVAPVPRMGNVESSVNASNLGGSSWYVLSSAPQKELAIDFLKSVWGSDVDFYQEILINQGALGTYMPAREGEAFQASDEFFGGQPVWQNFSNWLAEIPAVNYGIFTEEADSAVVAQIPAITSGGNIDEIVSAIDAQVRQQTQ
ncbi:lactose/L-arabinose transport system substrate-binding protein [Devosia subaequoris]|uniref:Lactose/L-arabinose transport system substrate-binding protein n=1 Tax=Devosia subaequoris TaxID=395930 RepID=A0A7W6IRM6_9HYPH|nr:extracellular solute-binding protein [Devosia subaequoris]MBB4053830.1 lactose/L-arabinose transport system substrate-binding protein [Devosia subaequoris]MCP1211151.1 extracellular solute-binding protein [Devosia subaequoris]